MELLKIIPLCVVIIAMVAGRRRMGDISELSLERVRNLKMNSREGPKMCARLAKEPYFKLEMLLGQTWRVYYLWHTDLQKQCIDMTFWNATPSIINRMHHDMSEYLRTEPQWDTASVLVRLGRSKHSVLLFADPGSPGRFQGVPNLFREGDLLPPAQNSVPLLNFHLKLLYGGKYLLMADCQGGVTSLSAPRRNIPYRADIANIAKNLSFGPGHQACLSDMNKDEATQAERK